MNRVKFNKYVRSRDSLCNGGNQQIVLISADEKPLVECLNAAVDVLLFAAEEMNSKDVTRNESG